MDRVSRKVIFYSNNNELRDQPGKFRGLVPSTLVLARFFELVDPNEELDHPERV